MKVLTVKEPWASLIINSYKKYEFRSWKTNYRGKILIHSGKSMDKYNLDIFKEKEEILNFIKCSILLYRDIINYKLRE